MPNTPKQQPHILVVDDDDRLRLLLQEYLHNSGMFATAAEDPKVANDLMQYFQFDLLILDIMMPYQTGLEFLETIRQRSNVPVILLTARGETEDRIHGLALGSDDYLPKPFDPRELILRVQRILGRSPTNHPVKNELKFGNYRFCLSRDELYHLDRLIPLTTNERLLLRLLVERANQVVPREDLSMFEDLSESAHSYTAGRAIDVQIARLRKKIESDIKNPRFLQTIRNKGYILRT